jgi:hypothetical protein
MTSDRGDLPQRLLATAIHLLPRDRAEWGLAMTGELDELSGRAERWRFALSCSRATVVAPSRMDRGNLPIVAAFATATAACGVLTGVAFARYPGIVTGAGTWLALAAFLVALAAYLAAALVLLRRLDRTSIGTVRVALVGGAVVATLWLAVGGVSAWAPSKTISTVLLLVAPAASVGVGAVAGLTGRSFRTGCLAILLSAVGAGLIVFIGWVGDTLLNAGRPYDSGMVRDFHSSGAHDLATYAVNDNLGSAMVLLVMVPLVATFFGLVGVALAAGRDGWRRVTESPS